MRVKVRAAAFCWFALCTLLLGCCSLMAIRSLAHEVTCQSHLPIKTPIHGELLKGPILPSQMNCAS